MTREERREMRRESGIKGRPERSKEGRKEEKDRDKAIMSIADDKVNKEVACA